MRLGLYIFIFSLLISCKRENYGDCFKSNGNDITETRLKGNFERIEVRSNIELSIGNGSEYKIEVTCGKNIIKNISTEIQNGLLVIENKNTCNFVRGYKRKLKVRVTTPLLKKITNNGVGPVRFDENFQQDSLYIRAENSGDVYINGTFNWINSSSHGNGDVHFKGSAKTLLIYTNGTNFIRAENFLVSEQIYISTYSFGDAFFNFKGLKQFDYYINSGGNIYYTGNPNSIKNLGNEEAKGKLIKQD